MLGCMRLEVAIARLIDGYFDSFANAMDYTRARARGFSDQFIRENYRRPDNRKIGNSGLVRLLEIAFEGMKGNRASRGGQGRPGSSRQTQGLTATAATGATAPDLTGSMLNTQAEDAVQTKMISMVHMHIKNFTKLFLTMHSSDAERGDSVVLVSIIAELLDVMLVYPSAALRSCVDHLFRATKDKLIK
jgi:hypothetical protein